MKTLLDWRHQYDVARDKKEGDLAALECKDESLTQQHFTEDADINVLAKRFGLTEIPLTALDPALFRDTTNDPELRDVLDIQRDAKERFLALPAKLRKRFHNSPRELWDFVNDPENAEEAVRLGLLAAPTAPNATPSSATETTASPSNSAKNQQAPSTESASNTEQPPKPPQGA